MSASGTVGGRVVFSNDRVGVWDDTVAPGVTQELHTHTNPYLAVAIAGDRAETIGPELLPATHGLRNTGATEISVVIIEFL